MCKNVLKTHFVRTGHYLDQTIYISQKKKRNIRIFAVFFSVVSFFLNGSVNRWCNHVSIFLIGLHQLTFNNGLEISSAVWYRKSKFVLCSLSLQRCHDSLLSTVDVQLECLKAGMAARAIARQRNVHVTTICRWNARQMARETPGFHQDQISD